MSKSKAGRPRLNPKGAKSLHVTLYPRHIRAVDEYARAHEVDRSRALRDLLDRLANGGES